ncbi:SDR family NAD(P)-dependent oxidoreductase [Roseomonas sp. NAR14]|uniref:SDR family NAD(P)-dependent oxidoreductase n=2 Tax=Roseomonas acroporae TaxID=2937791 RepID=A0A9X1Y9D9_9PROT|nr:SDR family NAD(P)-dependent oxidoreductase [Roseomonas acroporae]MCK8785886.1 SDR family NAD(P)-dependent oxidoreductase [Roseomonas acroporae]
MAAARAAAAAGWVVCGTARDPSRRPAPPGIEVIPFDAAGPAIAAATHLLVTAAPGAAGDPVLAAHAGAIRAARRLAWIGYVSTTAVYGDRAGGLVDEDTPPAPRQERGRRRLAAELGWAALATGRTVDLLRTGGIYGPGRSALNDLREGTARRVIRPGHRFSRIHRDDIAHAALAAMEQNAALAAMEQTAAGKAASGTRVLHLVDDEPAESAAVVEEAARLLGVPPPPALSFAEAEAAMSPMARSFWSERREVSSARTQALLGIRWLYPTYREGLRAILQEEQGERPA